MKKRGDKNSQKKISNRWLYTLVALGIFALIAVGVYALTPGVKPNPGHSFDEVAVPSSSCLSNNFLQWGGNAWKCAQMTGDFGTGASWVSKDSARGWRGVAMSSDALYQTAVSTTGGSDYIYISNDSGNTWTAKGVSKPWKKVAISANGQYQSAVAYNNQIYISSNYGSTWTAKDSSRTWYSIAMSNDGKYQSAVAYNNQIYISSNYGSTWTAKESSRSWTDIAVSSTGQYQSATAVSGYIYISSDYGNSWVAEAKIETYVPVAYKNMEAEIKDLPYKNEQNNNEVSNIYDTSGWTAIDISGDGKYQSAYRNNGGEIYVSSDYGYTWAKKFSNPNHLGVNNLALSSTGQYQIIGISSDFLYFSSDYGNTWTTQESARYWIGVAISADGQSRTATTDGGNIYVYSPNGGSSNPSFFGHNATEFAAPQGCTVNQFLQWDGSNWKCGTIDASNYYINDWTARGFNKTWEGLAMSSDGHYQTAASFGGQIYVSIDYGNTWTAEDSNREWTGVAISNSGQYQIASVRNGAVYTSSNYGTSWTARSVGATSVGISGDGKYQVAAGSQVYVSTDYGVSWTAKGSSITYWFGGAAISDDGKYISAAHGYQGKIYVSSDYGATWTTKGTNQYWNGLTMSANGRYQTAVTGGNQLYISTDYGVSWTAKVSGNHYWWGVAMSNDGKYQLAGIYGAGLEIGRLWFSSDYGNTWTLDGIGRSWFGVAISDDGVYQTAAADSSATGQPDYIYTKNIEQPPQIHPSFRHNLTDIAPPIGCTANQFVDWTGSSWKCATN